MGGVQGSVGKARCQGARKREEGRRSARERVEVRMMGHKKEGEEGRVTR